MNPLYLFVYGSLMSGQTRHYTLSAYKREPALARGKLVSVYDNYPAAIFDDAAPTTIRGELVTIDRDEEEQKKVLQELDWIEAVGMGYYERCEIKVGRLNPDGTITEIPAISYQGKKVLEQPGYIKPIVINDWKVYREMLSSGEIRSCSTCNYENCGECTNFPDYSKYQKSN